MKQMHQVRRTGRRKRAVVAAIGLFTVNTILPWDARGGTTLAPFATADTSYTALANQGTYASVSAVRFLSQTFNQTFLSSGVLISPEWVLTAGHVAAPAETQTINFGGTNYLNGLLDIPDNLHFAHPGWNGSSSIAITTGTDIGLIHLSTPVTTIAPANRYFGSDEYGKISTAVGFGVTGDGNTGGHSVTTGSFATGVKRAVNNKIDAQGSDFDALVEGYNFNSNVLGSDFDNSTGAANKFGSDGDPVNYVPTSLEGITTPGDSGGGVFVNFNNRAYVAGVTSFILTSATPTPGVYGDVAGWTRVSSYNQWIDTNTGNYWNSATSGNYGPSITNWSMGPTAVHAVPTSSSIVGFNQAGNYTVTFGGATTNYQLLARAGNVTLDLGSATYNLTSTLYDGSLIAGRYNGETASITLRNGNLISKDATIGEFSGASGYLNVASGATWTANGNAYVGGSYDGAGGGGTLNVSATGNAVNINGLLRVYANGNVALAAGGNKTLRAKSLTISAGGKVDLFDNDMIVDYDGSSPLTTIKSQLILGRNNGNWAGNGITTTTAQSTTNTTLGYAEATALGLGAGSFNGVGLDTTSLIVKYTYYGDANLDGKVDIADLQRLAASWPSQTGEWTGGDFNYDGLVNITDLFLLAKDWQLGVSSPLGPSLSAALTSFGLPADFSSVPVPEPVGISVLGIIFAHTLRRRRGRHASCNPA